MFLIECPEDNFLSIIKDSDVIFENGIKIGDNVRFFYSSKGKKTWTGRVIARSDNETHLENLLKTMGKEQKEEHLTRSKPLDEDTKGLIRKDKIRKIMKPVRFSPNREDDNSTDSTRRKAPKKSEKSSKPKQNRGTGLKKDSTRMKTSGLDKLFNTTDSEDSSGSLDDYLQKKIGREKQKLQEQSSKQDSSDTKIENMQSSAKKLTIEEIQAMLSKALAEKEQAEEAQGSKLQSPADARLDYTGTQEEAANNSQSLSPNLHDDVVDNSWKDDENRGLSTPNPIVTPRTVKTVVSGADTTPSPSTKGIESAETLKDEQFDYVQDDVDATWKPDVNCTSSMEQIIVKTAKE